MSSPEPSGSPAQHDELLMRVGQLTRSLHESLRELGLDKLLQRVATDDIPNARDRLLYVARLTEQAAQRVLAVTGACMVLRRSDFEAVNGFDEAYRNGCEDLDLCFKLRARGQHAWLAGSSCIRHHVSLSRGRSSLQNLANSRLLFSRWRPLVQATLAGVWRQLLAAGEPAWRPYLRSRFTASAMRAPHALAGLVAQAMIHREEQHWARMLDGEGEASLAGCVWGSGQPAAAPGLPWTGLRRRGRLWLSATGIDSARNLQLRGRIVRTGTQRQWAGGTDPCHRPGCGFRHRPARPADPGWSLEPFRPHGAPGRHAGPAAGAGR